MTRDNYPHKSKAPEPSNGVAEGLLREFSDLFTSPDSRARQPQDETSTVEIIVEEYTQKSETGDSVPHVPHYTDDTTVHEGTIVGAGDRRDEVLDSSQPEKKSSLSKKILIGLGATAALAGVTVAATTSTGGEGGEVSNQPLANASILMNTDVFPAVGENSVIEQFSPYSLDCPEFATLKIDTVVPLYYGLNVNVEGSDKTATVFIAPKEAADRLGISSDNVQPIDELEWKKWKMPEKLFANKKEAEEGEYVSRYPRAGMVNENVTAMLCHDSDGAIVMNPDKTNTATVNLAKFSLVATYPERGDPDAPKGLIQQYEPITFKNPDVDTEHFSSDEKHRFNQFASPIDDPNTTYDEGGLNPLIMNELVYGALKSVNDGECRNDIRTLAKQYIVKTLSDQAKEQGAAEPTIEFINDFGQMPHQAFAETKGGEEMIDSPNVVVDFTYENYEQAEACTVLTESKE